MKLKKENIVARLGTLTLVLAGCGSAAALPTESSTSGIRAAEEVGAQDVPRAALHLQLAKEGLLEAKAWAKKGDADRAKSILARAEVDAQLAVALSRHANEKSEAAAAVDRVRDLRREHKLSREDAR